MKKYILLLSAFASISAGATTVVTISSGTHVVTSGAVQTSLGTLNFVNNGVFTDATGTVNLLGTIAFSGSGTTTLNNLVVNASGNTSICSAPVSVSGVVTMTAGTLNANSNLTLLSTASGTARVAAITSGSITNNVNVQQYIPGGKRTFRFLGHPFSTSIPLSQLENNIDITGTGGSLNGFTNTITNNPSAFWYNPLTGDGSTVDDVTGWIAFTSTNGSLLNAWNPTEGIRLLVRGTAGQGLDGNSYTPNAVTLNMNGPVNQGSVSETMLVGAASGYNLFSNPYPSPTDIGTVIQNAAANMSGAGYWVWNAEAQTQGAYRVQLISAGAYVLPANASFVVNAAVNTSTLNFSESNKVAIPTNDSLFRVASVSNGLTLDLYDNTMNSWDLLYISFNNNAADSLENNDAKKLHNSALDFYSFSSNNQKLCIDTRPYVAGQVIPLGLATDVPQTYIIKAENYNLPAGDAVYLHDKYLNQYQQLENGSEYKFTVNANAASQGDNRFELGLSQSSTGITTVNNNSLKVNMMPNPATDQVTISYQAPKSELTSIRMVNMAGQDVVNMDLGTQVSGNVNIPLHNIAAGMYLVTFTSGNQVVTQRLVKQ